ncbi:MAG: DEAD/DEAH box helicase family protein [Hafnia sp.]
MKRPPFNNRHDTSDLFSEQPVVDLASSEPLPDVIATDREVRSGNEIKLAIFNSLFRGRSDVVAKMFGNPEAPARKYGYMPACGNDKHPVLCKRPAIPCERCENRLAIPLSDELLRRHFLGECILGMYPLLQDNSCYFVAVDFDESDWRADALAFVQSCRELSVPVSLEISRSGNGAHGWIFFEDKVQAVEARRLATAILSHACSRTGILKFGSYDRLFPNQDLMPKGGFGNLIALPLQLLARSKGRTVFVDETFEAYPDQWQYLAGVELMSPKRISDVVFQAVGDADPLDVVVPAAGDLLLSMARRRQIPREIHCVLPKSIVLRLEEGVYLDRAGIPQQLIARLVRLASFSNPEFFKAQAAGRNVYLIPRVICCAELTAQHLILPRGCLAGALSLLEGYGVGIQINDERHPGEPISVSFKSALHSYQEEALSVMLESDDGVLLGGTAFGKTVIGAAAIARRGVSTIVLVHSELLLKQWRSALKKCFGVGDDVVGVIHEGKDLSTGIIDVALMQSLSPGGKCGELIKRYGHVIVDECHRLGAKTYQNLIRRARGRFVMGLSASKKRRDGHHPMIFMQCGPIRYIGEKPKNADAEVLVKVNWISSSIPLPKGCAYTDLISFITQDADRTSQIVEKIVWAYQQGRKMLVLTARIEHMLCLEQALAPRIEHLLIIHGGLTKKSDKVLADEEMDRFRALAFEIPRVVVTTGKMAGEGFDHPPLNTLVLATPISWEEDVKQYSGRVDRNLIGSVDTWIIDFVDVGHEQTAKMWKKRKLAYSKLRYRIQDPRSTIDLFDS